MTERNRKLVLKAHRTKTAKEVARINSTANARWRSREAGWDREFQLKERREARCAPQG